MSDIGKKNSSDVNEFKQQSVMPYIQTWFTALHWILLSLVYPLYLSWLSLRVSLNVTTMPFAGF